jgi:hypothetical protein
LVRLEHGELQQLVGGGGGQRGVLFGGEGAEAMPGLRGDDDPGAATGDDDSDLIQEAVSTKAWTDWRDDTSTVVVLTSNPASNITLAAASAFSRRRSASRTCLPALTRRAMA